MATVSDLIGLFNDLNPPGDGSESDTFIRVNGVGVFTGTVWDGGGLENKVRAKDEGPDQIEIVYTPDNGIFLTETSPQALGSTTGILDKAGLTPIVGHSAVIAYVTLRDDTAASTVRFSLHDNGSLEETILISTLDQWTQGTPVRFVCRKLESTIEVEIYFAGGLQASHTFNVVPAGLGNMVSWTQGAQDYEITQFDWINLGGVEKMYRVRLNYIDLFGAEKSVIKHYNDTNQDNVYTQILADVATIGGHLLSVVWLAVMPVYAGVVGDFTRVYYIDVTSELDASNFTARRTRLVIANTLALALVAAQDQSDTDSDTVLKIQSAILDPEGKVGEFLYSALGFNSVEDYLSQVDTSPIMELGSVPLHAKIDFGGGFSPSATFIEVDSVVNINVGDVLVAVAGERILVDTVNRATDEMNVTRGYLGSTAAGLADEAVLTIVKP